MSASVESDGNNGLYVELCVACKFNDRHCGNG